MIKKKSTQKLPNLEEVLQVVGKFAPSLPKKIAHSLAFFTPKIVFWTIVLIVVLSGYFALFDPQTTRLTTISKLNYYLQLSFNAVASVALLSSISLLKKHSLKGWRMLYYLSLIYLILFLVAADMFGVALVLIFLYLLVQIRPYFT